MKIVYVVMDGAWTGVFSNLEDAIARASFGARIVSCVVDEERQARWPAHQARQ